MVAALGPGSEPRASGPGPPNVFFFTPLRSHLCVARRCHNGSARRRERRALTNDQNVHAIPHPEPKTAFARPAHCLSTANAQAGRRRLCRKRSARHGAGDKIKASAFPSPTRGAMGVEPPASSPQRALLPGWPARRSCVRRGEGARARGRPWGNGASGRHTGLGPGPPKTATPFSEVSQRPPTPRSPTLILSMFDIPG